MNIPINDQQAAEQTILLNAIRNKFANNENHSGTSPPVFSIPSLKLPQFSPTSNALENANKAPASKLNQFILSKLGENNAQTNVTAGSFKIPDLKIESDFVPQSFSLGRKPSLDQTNSNLSESNINSLNKGISNLRVCEEQKNHVIDLTTALNQSTTLTASPAKQMTTKPNAPNAIDFQIPFIDCDLKEASERLPLRDEYCVTDVSNFAHRRFICAPSRFGKITCLKYRLPKRSILVDHSFAQKNKIKRFIFDTKSPDDTVLSLRRFNRV
ncbi:uncharacterized protein LOC129944195 [Eupeodes corollae]|uniref:uncharacterized protein LOC129944195 n=1 Tax=Eupeodes corollae TaxID=290404 RepID=UPI002492FA5D|nr:uncharacterized protein LOC129944195 [Eupeodes corollae]